VSSKKELKRKGNILNVNRPKKLDKVNYNFIKLIYRNGWKTQALFVPEDETWS